MSSGAPGLRTWSSTDREGSVEVVSAQRASLGAPTLCPRCDMATLGEHGEQVDQCPHCALQLRWCGNCRGVAGPFDRFCGFCGFELIRGRRTGSIRRAWALVAAIPLAAGLAYGVSVAVTRHPDHPRPVIPASLARSYRSPALAIDYAVPQNWMVVDYASDGGISTPYVVISQSSTDQAIATDAHGDLTRVAQPDGTLVTIGRSPSDALAADDDPVAVLSSELAPFVARPPAGTSVAVARPVRSATVGGRPAAEAVLKVRQSGLTWYLERAVVYAPHPGLGGMVRFDAAVPASEWGSEQGTVDAILSSLRFA
jgi:hypothetical protein